MTKNIIAIVLCGLMLLQAVSCSSNANEQNGNSSVTDTTSANTALLDETEAEPEVETADPAYVHNVEATDYDGKTFTIIYPTWSLYNRYLKADEYTGAAMNDALYDRTLAINEYVNCNIEWNAPGYIDKIETTVGNAVLSGDETYQLALTHCFSGIASMITQNYVLDWNDMPGVDLTKSYWNQYVINNMQILGTLPMISGDLILADVNSIFYNKTLLSDYHLENPYELVYNGEWTIDKLIEMSSEAGIDLNGDGIMDDSDQYGFVMEYGWQVSSFQAGAGISTLAINSDNEFEITTNNEKYIGLAEKLSEFFGQSDYVRTWNTTDEYDPNNGGTPPSYFIDGRALFFSVPLSYAEAFRNVEIGFGILPFPKYDEVQEDYYSFNWAGYMCIPQTAGDLEFTGTVSELLQYYNHEKVLPAFYDNLLDQKIAMDRESRDMLELMFSNSVYDMGLMLNSELFWFNAGVTNAANYASFYKTKERATNIVLKKVIKEVKSRIESDN